MAEMIPESIAAVTGARPGEKRVFRCLRDALLPDEDYLVWFEPKSGQRRPDFLVWSQELGLLVMEVKDWSLATIVTANHERWTLRQEHGNITKQHPLEQARDYYIVFNQLLQKSSDLTHQTGPYQGNLKFPISYCAVFTNMTRKQAEESFLSEVLDTAKCLFSEDLSDDFESRQAQRTFLSTIKRAAKRKFFPTLLEPQELKTLRYLIFPEVRIHSVRSNEACTLRTPQQTETLRALDLEQERTAKSILEGHRVLKGVAGSGKTLVVSCRAKYLKKLQPAWRVLIVCYNISLCQYIRQLLTVAEPNASQDGIDVYHYHGLVKALTGANLGKLASESQDEWDARVGTILREEIASGKLTQRYDAILIDEGQDFAVEWLHSLTELLDENSDSLLFCLDPAQNIFGRKVSYKSVGIKVQGKRPISLKKSYRNTAEILSVARRFSKVQDTKLGPDEDLAIESELFPLDANRHGPSPQIVCRGSSAEQIGFILDTIHSLTESGACSWCDIGVLYTARSFATQLSPLFRERFGDDRLYWVTESQQSKMSLDLASPSVKLSTIESAKGMEFRLVFLVGLDTLPRPERDEADERKLAYVGLTRAQDLLYLLGSKRVGLLQELAEIIDSDLLAPQSLAPKPIS